MWVELAEDRRGAQRLNDTGRTLWSAPQTTPPPSPATALSGRLSATGNLQLSSLGLKQKKEDEG